jgi:hypothetical protein
VFDSHLTLDFLRSRRRGVMKKAHNDRSLWALSFRAARFERRAPNQA